jgi:glycosyltransferase involved in cell wall biosynthesis
MFDCVTAPSTFLGSVLDKSGLFTSPVRIIHSGHNLAWLSNMPEKRPSKVVRLGFIGQLIPVKGVDLLIRAFLAANVEGKAELLIYGDTASYPQYAASLEVTAQGSDNIHFMDAFPPNKLGEVLAEIDVLVVPSQWHENSPRVIQEAFAGKIPVIASSVGGIAEFIQHGVNGLLFQFDQEDQLRDQIRRVVNEPALVSELRRGIGKVRTISEEVEEFIGIYLGLINPFSNQPAASDLEHDNNVQRLSHD